MIKVFVAEDQILIQKDICRKIEKTEKDIEIVGTAINGEDAFQKIILTKPDILITDIRMPILSGLDLIRRIKGENLAIKTVILSGYRDFEYAKAALHLGVDEYLLKPVSIEDLKYVLEILEEKIYSQRDCIMHDALQTMLISGTPFPKSLIESLPYSHYRLMIINLNSYTTLSIQDWFPFENELDNILKNGIVHKYLKSEEKIYICKGNAYNQKILLFCLTRTPSERLDMLAGELIKAIEKITVAVSIVLSSNKLKLELLNIEYKIMQKMLEKNIIFSKSSLLNSRISVNNTKIFDINVLDLNQLIFAINAKDIDGYLSLLHNFLCYCEKNLATQKYIERSLKEILNISFSNLERIQITNKELEIDEYLSNTKNYEELFQAIEFMFRQLFDENILNLDRTVNPEELVEEIKNYIHSNYSKEISINDVAKNFLITPAYLSRVFKKYTNIRPIEYLTKCRIEKACEFFSNSQLTIKEVAQLCGYSNQFYFSKTFKQVMKVSPSEYQIQNCKNKI